MTSPASSAVQSAVPLPEPAAKSHGVQARARESLPAALPLTPVRPAGSDTESLIPAQARKAALHLLGAFVIPRGTNLLATDHGSLLSAHARHKEAAAHWEDYPPVRVFRRAWGCLHLLVKAVLDIAEWIAESPARTVAVIAAYYICTHWL